MTVPAEDNVPRASLRVSSAVALIAREEDKKSYRFKQTPLWMAHLLIFAIGAIIVAVALIY
jgi:hypothetical protein